MSEIAAVHIEPWGDDDLSLLQKLVGDPAMMEHLDGPESDEKISERHARYVTASTPAEGRVFKIVVGSSGEGVGWVGYWEQTWHDVQVYEIGWSVLPEFQGRGIAGAATQQAIAVARSERRHQNVHAFPSIANAPSNAICRKLGFTLIEPCDIEFPKGTIMRCNDWRLELFASRPGGA